MSIEKWKNVKIEKKMFRNILTELSILLLMFNYLLYYVQGIVEYKNITRIVAISILMLNWFITEKTFIYRSEFLLLLLGGGLILSGRVINIVAVLLIAICIQNDMGPVIKSAFKINFILASALLCLMLLNIVDKKDIVAQGRVRSGLGFLHPNAGALFFTSVIFLYLLERGIEVKKIEILVSLILSFVIYKYTDSRTPMLASLVYYIFLIVGKCKNNNLKKNYDKICLWIVDLIFIIHLIAIFIIDKLYFLDDLFSRRILFFHRSIEKMSIMNLFFGGMKDEVDNFYFNVIMNYGIIIYLLIFYLIHRAVKKSFQEESERVKISFIISILVICIMEGILCRPEIGIVYVFWGIIAQRNVKSTVRH